MNSIRIFDNAAFGQIRTAGTGDEPLFCLADVCRAVELANPSSVKGRLDKEDVQLIDLHALNITEGIKVGNSMATFVTESGFYDVILYSKSTKVKPFRKWITSEVLPSIRKTGKYQISAPSYQIEDPIARAQRWIEEQLETRKLAEQNKSLADANHALVIENAQMKPKSDYYDDLVEAENALGFRETAKILPIPPKKFVAFLLDKKYVYCDDEKRLMPYASQVSSGLFVVKERKSHDNSWTGSQTLITTKERDLFRELFMAERIANKRVAGNKSITNKKKNFLRIGYNLLIKSI
jgi:anti-repressor protein